MIVEQELLKLERISKSYGKNVVLDNIDFTLRKGEVHALVGENGAGKSTMIKIISGNVVSNGGKIYVGGKEAFIRNSRDAHVYGISTVYQELVQAPYLSIAENVFMGRLPKNKAGLIDRKKLNKMTADIMGRIKADFDPDTRLDRLSIAQRQMVEILKALSHNSKIIIFDEPTSSLSNEECSCLFEIIELLKSQEIGVIYISHRMDEIFSLTNRITVLRDGHMIRTLDTEKTNRDEITSLMVGRDLTNLYPKEDAQIGEEILRVENLTSDYVHDVSFHLKRGEILGFGGLVGAGRTELMLSLIGRTKYTGKISLKGKEVQIKCKKDAINHGISYLTEDRKALGVIYGFEIYKNTTLSTLKKHSRAGVLNLRRERETGQDYFKKMNVMANDIFVRVGTLSGGNQQKVMLSRCLASSPEILILDEPTRGVDVGAKAEIYNIISKLAGQGVAIIIISSELPELIAMSDRIVVMYEGGVSGELLKEEINEITIMKYASR